MKPDIEKYRVYVAHMKLCTAQETEIIQTVFNVIQNGFDRALGDDPVQACLEFQGNKIERR